MTRRNAEQDVLDYPDNCAVYNPGCFCMYLERDHYRTASSRPSPFANYASWAIAFEMPGYANREGQI